MAIIYSHHRKTNNEIFYIGIGKNIKRAFDKRRNNKYWKNIVKKYDYTIEILCENLSWEQACEAEIFLINFYGRKDLKTGPLVNLTIGGDGMEGMSEMTKNKIKKSFKNRKISEKTLTTLFNNSISKQIPVIQYDLKLNIINNFVSLSAAARFLNIKNSSCLIKCCKGKLKSSYGYIWRYDSDNWFPPSYELKKDTEEYKSKMRGIYNTNCKIKNEKNMIPINQYDKNGIFIKKWPCAAFIEKELGISGSHIGDSCRFVKGRKFPGGFMWRFA